MGPIFNIVMLNKVRDDELRVDHGEMITGMDADEESVRNITSLWRA